MKILPYFLLTVFIGIVVSVHLAMNSQAGAFMKNTAVGNAVFWTIGAVTAIIVGMIGWKEGALSNIRDVPVFLLTAGAMGALVVFGIAWTLDGRMSAGSFFITMLAGQVVTGFVISHFGMFGQAVDPISRYKILGVVLMLGGAAIATFAGTSSDAQDMPVETEEVVGAATQANE